MANAVRMIRVNSYTKQEVLIKEAWKTKIPVLVAIENKRRGTVVLESDLYAAPEGYGQRLMEDLTDYPEVSAVGICEGSLHTVDMPLETGLKLANFLRQRMEVCFRQLQEAA
ncbi:hypothetical protein [Gallaecimonas pentaromativorans]|uniref:hypothetical protein n=1 Tax=Gallaecimonas pentaromativorans TaxID=584787 RepID=UPI00067E6B32|nr:hypothetical protein [Gallaecimonas pentaromativorans]